jgi:hypothetical protein
MAGRETGDLLERLRRKIWKSGSSDDIMASGVTGFVPDEKAALVRIRVLATRPEVVASLQIIYGSLIVTEVGDWGMPFQGTSSEH